jgi:hypothetical protein
MSTDFRISRVPGKPVHRQRDGRYALPLWLREGGRFSGDVTLHLTPSEAELLHAQLCYALDDWPRTLAPGTPDPECHKPGHGSTGVR